MTTLTMQDEKRLDMIQRVYRSELTMVQAALLCLIGAIDDATNKVMGALFVQAESSWGYFHLVLRDLQGAWSVPVNLYRLSLGILDRPGTNVR
jgi:hypothetical protein